jgi:hypothetical protein
LYIQTGFGHLQDSKGNPPVEVRHHRSKAVLEGNQ